MITRTLKGIVVLTSLFVSIEAFAGYRTFLDPRSMAMGGTGVAASTKFNASFHNPALIAFSKGDKPDKIYISASQGLREVSHNRFENKLQEFQRSGIRDDFLDALGQGDAAAAAATFEFREKMRDLNLESYRKDETSSFSVLADTRPFTFNFYVRNDTREMVLMRNRDDKLLSDLYRDFSDPDLNLGISDVEGELLSSVDDVYFELQEFGGTVATTNVIEYNIPISWGFTPKLIEIRGSQIGTRIHEYDLGDRPEKRVSGDFLEWNLDLGFAALLTDDFLESELGLDGWWLEGEWVFAFAWMNIVPTDFNSFSLPRQPFTLPGEKRAVQAMYQVGIAHYRENYMFTIDIDLDETEVWSYEGNTRFISLGGEYYWRDDFHLRAGMRFNTAQTSEAGQDKALLTGGFLYQPHGFSIEAAAVLNDVEKGGSVGFGLAF